MDKIMKGENDIPENMMAIEDQKHDMIGTMKAEEVPQEPDIGLTSTMIEEIITDQCLNTKAPDTEII